jgi:RND family efflux transporter MFP subunit
MKGIKARFYRRKKFWIISVIIISVFSFFYFKTLSSKNSNNVESTEIKKGTVEEVLTLSGEINADEYVKLTYPSSGEIAWVGVKEGDEVKKGQALTKLNTVVLNAAFQQAKATLRAAEATVENVHDQVKDHSGDETFAQKNTRTTAEAAKDSAYEAYVAAEYNLRHSTILSPFAGVVTYLAHPYSGMNVLVTETQVEIINPESIYFDVSADQSEVVDIIKGQKVSVILDSHPDEILEGVVDFIGYTPKAGEAGTVYKTRVKFEKGDFDFNRFRIGMSGDARFLLSQKDNVLYVPPKYVSTDSKGKYVSVGSKSNKVYVEIGIEGEDKVEIKGDVKEGDVIFD